MIRSPLQPPPTWGGFGLLENLFTCQLNKYKQHENISIKLWKFVH